MISQTVDLLKSHLIRDGIARSPEYMPNPNNAVEWLKSKSCYNAHVKVYSDKQPRRFWDISETHSHWCHDMKDVLQIPGFFEYILNYMPLAKEYLGEQARLYSVNAYWSRPVEDVPIKDLQTWHVDKDDEKFLALFIYATDIHDFRDGPHCYKLGTHTGKLDVIRAVTGQAGTTFLTDPRGLHRGSQPKRGTRCLLWARFGVSNPPPSYIWDELSPVDKVLIPYYPEDPDLQERIRLVVQ